MSAYNGIVTDLDEREYHAHPSVSSTQARLLLKAPGKYKHSLTHPQPHKDAFDLGTLVHSKVLGVGQQLQVIPENVLASNGAASTKAAKEFIEQSRSGGFIPVKQEVVGEVDAMAESVLAHPEARPVLEAIKGREVSLFAEVDGVPMRARFDLYDGNMAADLKSARDASRDGFNNAVHKFGYHIQDRWYEEVHMAVTGHALDSFKFVVVENTAPYLVAVYDLDFMWGEIAKERTERARELYRACMADNEWPGYQSGTLTPPTYAVYANEEEEIDIS